MRYRLALFRELGFLRHENGLRGTYSLLVSHGATDKTLIGDRDATEHRPELLEERDKVRVQFGKNVFIADDLGQVARTNWTESPRDTCGIHDPTRQEGRYWGVLPIGVVASVLLFFAPFLFFLKALRRVHNAGCDAPECAPDHGACAERSSSVFASQSDQGIAAPFAARHRIGNAEDVGDSVASNGVAEAQRARGQSAWQELAAQGANGRAAEESIVGGVRWAAEREVGEDVRMTRGIGCDRG